MSSIYKLEDILDIVNAEIANIRFTQKPESLFEPISYILSLGGKRIRPALALMACNLYTDDISKALPIAKAVEVFHNFTLLHDDLMDRADMRRGKQTVHLKWNDNTAILSGDAMLIEAYREICKVDSTYLKSILDLFSKTASEICSGQQYDMEFERRLDVTIPEYLEMIRLKTAVLLGCALKEGAMVAGAPEEDLDNLYEFGINLGLAFQLKDDLLDVYGDTQSFGKKTGGDIVCNKKTYLLINALDDPSVREDLLYWINIVDFNESDKIEAVKNIYDKLKLKERTEHLIRDYYKKSINYLNQLNLETGKKVILQSVAEQLMSRNS